MITDKSREKTLKDRFALWMKTVKVAHVYYSLLHQRASPPLDFHSSVLTYLWKAGLSIMFTNMHDSDWQQESDYIWIKLFCRTGEII